jgi:putative mRNA 3-end processing factor
VTGDYKLQPDPTCAPFEPLRCHTFVTEATFGLPVYRWPSPADVFAQIQAWRQANREAGLASVLFGYSLGKAQRLLAGLAPEDGPIWTHSAVERMNAVYRAAGVALPETLSVAKAPKRTRWDKALIIAPSVVAGMPWMRRFGDAATAFVSGWTLHRAARRWRAMERGFTLSDHADWPGLVSAIKATGAERIWTTHGYAPVLARWLREQGLDAQAIRTPAEDEQPAEEVGA